MDGSGRDDAEHGRSGDAGTHGCVHHGDARGHAAHRAPNSASEERLRAMMEDMVALENEGTMCETMSILAEAGLTLPQLVTLGRINAHGAHSITRIAAHLGLSQAATSHLVDRMVRQGLVTRVEDVEDRRQKRVSITAEGQQLAKRILDARVREVSRMLAGMPEDLASDFERVMQRVVAFYKSKASEPK